MKLINPDEYTSFGDWETETESVEYVKDLLKRSELFNIYREVEGQIMHPRPFCEEKGVRIDFILTPKDKLRNAGWNGGPIGLECKKSGIKLNSPLAQVMDYSRTVWLLKNGYMFMCQYYFIWPYHKVQQLFASIMAQNRIGTCSYEANNYRKTLGFFCGEAKVIKYDFESSNLSVGKCDFGFKTGSR